MYKTDLVDARGTSCSIWIDLTEYPMPNEVARDDLGLSNAQLDFARTLVVNAYYPGTYTTLFYRYCSMRVENHIPKTFAKIVSTRLPYIVMEPQYENYFDLPVLKNFDTFPYRTIKPVARVVSYPHNSSTDERIVVHRNLAIGRYMVQYQYRNDLSYHLLKRLERLCRHSESVLVTNATIRQMLCITN